MRFLNTAALALLSGKYNYFFFYIFACVLLKIIVKIYMKYYKIIISVVYVLKFY